MPLYCISWTHFAYEICFSILVPVFYLLHIEFDCLIERQIRTYINNCVGVSVAMLCFFFHVKVQESAEDSSTDGQAGHEDERPLDSEHLWHQRTQRLKVRHPRPPHSHLRLPY